MSNRTKGVVFSAIAIPFAMKADALIQSVPGKSFIVVAAICWMASFYYLGKDMAQQDAPVEVDE